MAGRAQWRQQGRGAASDTEWARDAKCKGITGLFYPDTDNGQVQQAKMVCRGQLMGPECPVRSECLEWALANKETYGVWGGCSERERGRIRRERALNATPLPESPDGSRRPRSA